MKEVKYYDEDLEYIKMIYKESDLWLKSHLYMENGIVFKLVACCNILAKEKIMKLEKEVQKINDRLSNRQEDGEAGALGRDGHEAVQQRNLPEVW